MRIGLVVDRQYDSLVDLLVELHAHYHQPPITTRAEVERHLRDRLLAPASPTRLVVAELPGDGVVGLAALVLLDSLIDPTPADRRQCQIKELYVRRAHRGRSIGKELMRWSAAYALGRGSGRMDWHVQAANRRGIAFYEQLGGTVVAERLNYRLDQATMERLARAPVI